jgi:hypothetical protein
MKTLSEKSIDIFGGKKVAALMKATDWWTTAHYSLEKGFPFITDHDFVVVCWIE